MKAIPPKEEIILLKLILSILYNTNNENNEIKKFI
tara:strand:- start:34 stop:138 length:105 start_codon:yes stop_codon:yes gene_type:complete